LPSPTLTRASRASLATGRQIREELPSTPLQRRRNLILRMIGAVFVTPAVDPLL